MVYVAVALQHSVAPGKIFRVLEALPWAAAFPFIVAFTTINTTLTPGLEHIYE
jgi:hypothetical protein